MATVIKPFAYAADGYTVESLVPGDERDFGVATDGLVDEGFIEADAAKADADAPAVPTSKRGK